MERINLKNDLQVDVKLEKIWEERYLESNDIISPSYQTEVLKNSVTFLSLNPSLLPKERNNAERGNNRQHTYPIVDCRDKTKIYSFFRKFYEIGEELNQPWTVLDFLYERESNQEELQIKYNPKTIREKDKKFLENQINLTFEILEAINPKVVIVSNSWTDKLLHVNLDDLNIIQELPCEENNFVYKLNNIPFITNESRFLGSRQHYISSKKDGRFEKLVNEIKRVLDIK